MRNSIEIPYEYNTYITIEYQNTYRISMYHHKNMWTTDDNTKYKIKVHITPIASPWKTIMKERTVAFKGKGGWEPDIWGKKYGVNTAVGMVCYDRSRCCQAGHTHEILSVELHKYFYISSIQRIGFVELRLKFMVRGMETAVACIDLCQ